MKFHLSALILSIGLTACAAVGTQFAKMEEAQSGERARVRVAANMLVKAVPESSCLDWSKPGAGTIFGGIVGSSGYRNRTIGMPNPNGLKGRNSGEFYVSGGKPFAFQLTNTPESRMRCGIDATFVPQAGHDYEITVTTEILQSSGLFAPKRSLCAARVTDITNGQNQPVEIRRADSCKP